MMQPEEFSEQQPPRRLGRAAVQPELVVADEATEPDLDDQSETISSDLVRVYLNGIGKRALLTAAEEVDLAKKVEAGLVSAEILRLRQLSDKQCRAEAHYNHEVLSDRAQTRIEKRATSRNKKLNPADKENIRAVEVPPVVRKDLRVLNRLAQNEAAYPEADLKALVRTGNRARIELLVANLRLVVSLAKRYTGRGTPLLDLIQEGNLGLIRAVEKFDYTQGFKFSTYATWWIRQVISRGMADHGRTIRVPVHMVEEINRVDRLRRELGEQLGRKPTDDELAQEAGMESVKLKQLLSYRQEPISLDQPIGNDGKAGPGETESYLGDFLEDADAAAPEDVAVMTARAKEIDEALNSLKNERERIVLRQRFGLIDGVERTLDDVGMALGGLSRERIRQIERNALAKLRASGAAEILKDFWV